MSKLDVSTNQYLEDPKRIADLLNVSTLHGKRLFLPENIRIRDSKNYLPNKNGKTIVINRDIVCDADVQMKITIIALENQSDIHYAMPVRVMSGDSANYHNQWSKIKKDHLEAKDLKGAEFVSGFSKEDKLIPISTAVVYFGSKPWDGPRCLKDILDLEGLPTELQDSIADYPINIIEVRNFPDYELFETDLKLVFGFLQKENDKNALEEFVNQNELEFEDLPDDTFNIIGNFSHSTELTNKKEVYKTKTGGVNMCKAIQDMIKDGEDRGYERGIEQGIEQGIQAIINICKEFGTSIETAISKIMNQFSFSEDKAHEYISKYWN